MSQRNFKFKKQINNSTTKLSKPKKQITKSNTINQKFRSSFISATTSIHPSPKSEISMIDDLIQKRNENKKKYSKSLVTSYRPLSTFDKIKEFTEINNSSGERFQKYSNIFEQIKQEINNINQIHLTSPVPYINDNYIEEKEEEYLITPKYPANKKVTFAEESITNTIIPTVKQFSLPSTNNDVLETDVDADEKKQPIKVSETKDYESMVELKMKYRKGLSLSKKNSSQVFLYKTPLSERNFLHHRAESSNLHNDSFDMFMNKSTEKFDNMNDCNICGCKVQ